jgi:hypothetical protein
LDPVIASKWERAIVYDFALVTACLFARTTDFGLLATLFEWAGRATGIVPGCPHLGMVLVLGRMLPPRHIYLCLLLDETVRRSSSG